MSDTVTGYIDHIIFRNEDNGYTVLVLKEKEKWTLNISSPNSETMQS